MAKYLTGRFVNGDPWVAPKVAGGTVTITGVDPPMLYADTKPGDKSVCLGGTMVDPKGDGLQGYTHRVGKYDPSQNVGDVLLTGGMTFTPTKPISLVKSVQREGDWNAANCNQSGGNNRTCIDYASILTILPAPPNDGANGAFTFRPAPSAGDKRMFTLSQVIEANLPAYAPPPVAGPSLAAIEYKFAAPQIDHGGTHDFRYAHPRRSFMPYGRTFATLPDDGENEYGTELSSDWHEALFRLMLNDPIADKRRALHLVLQACIDLYGARKAGTTWHADGGHNIGRKVMIAFAAMMFNDADMKAEVSTALDGPFQENRHVYRSAETVMNGMALFGKPGAIVDRETFDTDYDKRRLGGSGSKDIRDPFQVVDGGQTAGSSYQWCCTTASFMNSALWVMLFPGARAVWARDEFLEYADRRRHFGIWADNRHPTTGAVINRLNVDGTTQESRHNTAINSAAARSSFVDSMWDTYRNSAVDGWPAYPHYAKRTP